MDKRMKLAVKVKDYLISYTNRGFEVLQEDGCYLVYTNLKRTREKENEMNICYYIGQDSARIQVAVNDFKCTKEQFVRAADAKEIKFNLNAMQADESLFLTSQVSLKELDREIHIIAKERMATMMEIITNIIKEADM